MRVAIVLNTSWNIYNFRMNFIRSLIQGGYEVHTIAPEDEYTPLLRAAGCTHHRVRMDSRGANPIKDSALIIELWCIYRKCRPDVALHYTIKPNVYGTFAAALLGIPVINNVCGLGTVFLKNDLVSAIAKWLYRLSFRFPRKVFFQNSDDLNLFLNQKLVPKSSADLLPGSGIDLNYFRPQPSNRNKLFTFLMISRLISDKGVFEYVEAVRKLKAQGLNARFQILGAKDPKHRRGIKLKVIDEWIRSGTIEYLGTTSDVRAFLRQSDCVVLPSYREGTPRTLLEAASSGRPIIATDVPGCRSVVQDGRNGFLCNLRDADDLAMKMKTMASLDDHTLLAMGERGRKLAEAEFDESRVIDKYLAELHIMRRAS